MRGVVETNSGKLISLISSDLFTVERGLVGFPNIVGAPVINLVAFIFLWRTLGWEYMALVAGIWAIIMCLQECSARITKSLKQTEGAKSDERIKLMNDIIVGCRTIKCFGWEHHYEERISQIRQAQTHVVSNILRQQTSDPHSFPTLEWLL
mmetsp:Transcript_1952/g.2859  ORF Transcript_1952/g.2859 Transcript_1952/m.2859 type:complete len:151 (-) Transcript_1952:2932-3384(-)